MMKKATCLLLLVAVAQYCAAVPLTPNKNLAVDPNVVDEINSDNETEWKAAESPIFKGMTMEEVRSKFFGLLMDRSYDDVPVEVHDQLELEDLPAQFNSYEQWPNFMHPIRDQAHCGSCWAFAASEVLSDRFALASNGTINKVLSPEDLVSCDKGDMGCQGGYLDHAWKYLKESGIVTESCFPYSAGKGKVAACRNKCEGAEAYTKYKAADYYQLKTEEDIMKEIYLNGPVEAGFSVYSSFMSYKSGVYHKRIFDMIEGGHAIKIVGWGEEAPTHWWQRKPTKYWLCANSWTSAWGMDGFFKIKRGTNRIGRSECGIQSQVFAGHPLL